MRAALGEKKKKGTQTHTQTHRYTKGKRKANVSTQANFVGEGEDKNTRDTVTCNTKRDLVR